MDEQNLSIPSPCIRHCTLDDDDQCIGCGRTLDEIKRWSVSVPEAQQQILANANARLIQMKNRRGAR